MPIAKTDAGVVKYSDSLVYVIGGDNGLFGTGASTDVQLYNVNTNTWSHIVLALDAKTGATDIYVNNVLVYTGYKSYYNSFWTTLG